jgi:hypothetical protein
VPAAFHLQRLHAHASDDETWRAVDAVTFETFPLAREVRAIRRAVTPLDGRARPGGAQAVGGSASSTAGGKFPKSALRPAGGLEAKDVFAAYCTSFDDAPCAMRRRTRSVLIIRWWCVSRVPLPLRAMRLHNPPPRASMGLVGRGDAHTGRGLG